MVFDFFFCSCSCFSIGINRIHWPLLGLGTVKLRAVFGVSFCKMFWTKTLEFDCVSCLLSLQPRHVHICVLTINWCCYIYLKKKQQVLKREQFGRTNSVDVWKLSRNHRTVTFFFYIIKILFCFFFCPSPASKFNIFILVVFCFFFKEIWGTICLRVRFHLS